MGGEGSREGGGDGGVGGGGRVATAGERRRVV